MNRILNLGLLINGFLFAIAAAVPQVALGAGDDPAGTNQSLPNILFIFADDLSYNSIGAAGNAEVQTPNLDQLALGSTRFTHAYNMGAWGGAVCVASRTMLNTGRFVWHAHQLPLKEEQSAGRTWSQQMQQAGYETYFTGKWHVPLTPAEIFDYVGQVRGGMPKQTPEGYNRPIEGHEDAWSPYDKSKGGFWQGGKHWSEVVGDEAVGFLEGAKQRDKPFFMYIAFNAPHDPRQSPKEFVDKYPLEKISIPPNFLPEYPYKDAIGCSKQLRDEKLAPFPRTEYAIKVNRQEYYAIITHLDEQIGRILDALEKTGKSDNTFVFFTADHGLAVGHHGLVGKQNMFEHSMRVPFLVKGPGIARNQQINTRIYFQDIMPTTLQMAGADVPEYVQFKSLLPLLNGTTSEHYHSIYGGYRGLQRMVIHNDMKLIVYPDIKRALLFDLKSDPLEMNDLSREAEHADSVRSLFRELLKLQPETGDQLELTQAFPQWAKG